MLCVCLGCCEAEFGSSEILKITCISVFAFITCVEFVYEAFQLHYKLWEKHGITGQGSFLYICVWAKLRASC
jgi:hypothetical protein